MTENNQPRPSPIKVFLSELTNRGNEEGPDAHRKRGLLSSLLIPILAIFTGLVVGGIFIILTTESVYAAFQQSIGAGIAEPACGTPLLPVLFTGSFGSPSRIIAAIQSGDGAQIRSAFNPILKAWWRHALHFAGFGSAGLPRRRVQHRR